MKKKSIKLEIIERYEAAVRKALDSLYQQLLIYRKQAEDDIKSAKGVKADFARMNFNRTKKVSYNVIMELFQNPQREWFLKQEKSEWTVLQ